MPDAAPLSRMPEPATGRTVLRAEGVYQEWRDRTILAGIDFSIAAGEWVGIRAPRGDERDRALATLCGHEAPLVGEVYLDDAPLASPPPPWGLYVLRNPPRPDGRLRGRDCLRCRLAECGREEPPFVLDAALGEASLLDRVDAPVRDLNDQDRLLLMAALGRLLRPLAWLVEEPCAGIEEEARRALAGILDREAKRGAAILLVGAGPREAPFLPHRSLRLQAGHLLADEPARAAVPPGPGAKETDGGPA